MGSCPAAYPYSILEVDVAWGNYMDYKHRVSDGGSRMRVSHEPRDVSVSAVAYCPADIIDLGISNELDL